MTESDAIDELSYMVAADSEPTLDVGEILSLLNLARRRDIYGLAFGDDGWTPTWDLNAAAAEGWRRKAGKVAGSYSFASDGQSFSRSDMHAHCLEMAKMYRKGAIGSMTIGTVYTPTTDIVGNVNDG